MCYNNQQILNNPNYIGGNNYQAVPVFVGGYNSISSFNDRYLPLRNIGLPIEMIKEVLKFNNIEVITVNGFNFFKEGTFTYLIKECSVSNSGNNLSYESLIIERDRLFSYNNHKFLCDRVYDFKKPELFSAEKVYKMIKDLVPILLRYFYENLSLENIVYVAENDSYHVLTQKPHLVFNYGLTCGLSLKIYNLLYNKSVYTYKGNEIKTIKDLNIIIGGNINEIY